MRNGSKKLIGRSVIGQRIRGFDTPEICHNDTTIRLRCTQRGMVRRGGARITIRPMQSAVRKMVRRVNDDVGVGGILLER
jgi:hypothetical protein